MGHGPGSFGEAMGWGAVHIGKLVEAAAYAHEKALVLEPPQSGTRDASRIKVARTRNATLFREAKRASFQRFVGCARHVSYTRQ
jgi:hypothetical protein